MIILVLTWCDSMFDLVHRLSGAPVRQADDLNEAGVKLVVIILVWIFSAYKLYRIVTRLSYLEKFLHVCAWCRRIEYESDWFSLEDHFKKQTGGQTSHGICPECAERLIKDGIPAHACAWRTRQLEAAYQKVQEIAEKSVEGASHAKSFAELQKLLVEQSRKSTSEKG
jgi:hypothetical protein